MRDRDQGKDSLWGKTDVRRGQPQRSSGVGGGASDFREAGGGESWGNRDRDRDKGKSRTAGGVRGEAANESVAALATAQESAKEKEAKAKEEREKLKEARKVTHSGVLVCVGGGGREAGGCGVLCIACRSRLAGAASLLICRRLRNDTDCVR